MTVLAIETDIHGYYDHSNDRNRHSYYEYTGLEIDIAIVTVLALKATFMVIMTLFGLKQTFIAIVTAMVIETVMAIMILLTSKPTWLL